MNFEKNESYLDSISLDFYTENEQNKLKLTVSRRGMDYTLIAGENIWNGFTENFHRFSPYDRLEYATDQVTGFIPGTGFASYGWVDECTLQIKMRHSDQAARYTITIYFDAEYLTFEYHVTEMQSDFTLGRAVAKLPS